MLKTTRYEVLPAQPALTGRGKMPAAPARRRRVAAFISVDGIRHDVLITEAAGHDLLLRSRTRLPRATCLSVVFLSVVPTVEQGIPGIVHWDCERQGMFECGVALAQPVPAESLVAHPGCSRTSIRFACEESGNIQWNSDEAPSACRILNYSRQGLSFQVETQVRVGAAFTLSLPGQPGSSFSGTVRWVVTHGQTSVAGAALQVGLGYDISGVSTQGLSGH